MNDAALITDYKIDPLLCCLSEGSSDYRGRNMNSRLLSELNIVTNKYILNK